MVSLPNYKKIVLRSKYEKQLYYFDAIKLETDGFKLKEAVELKMNDSLPEEIHRSSRVGKTIAINDLYIVTVSRVSGDITTIFLRKNMKFFKNKDEIPVFLTDPKLIEKKEFKGIDEEYKFYKFCKTIENDKIRIRFENYVNKILFNGDQIIFMLADRIILYTIFSTSTIKIKPLDIAIYKYLYILTANSIHIYDEELIKTIDIDKKCKFIIPTAIGIFVIHKSIVYQIVDDQAEVFFDTIGFIESCVFDEKYLYLATNRVLYKIGIYDKDIKSFRYSEIQPRLYLTNDFLVIFNCSSGIIYIDRNDFSKFYIRNLKIDITDIASYNDTILYHCTDGLIICDYSYKNNDITLNKPRIESPLKFNIESYEDIKTTIQDFKVSFPYELYGCTIFNKNSKLFEKLMSFNNKLIKSKNDIENAINNESRNSLLTEQLLPSPLLTQINSQNETVNDQCMNKVLDSLFDPSNLDHNDVNIENIDLNIFNQNIQLNDEELKKQKKIINKAYKYIQKHVYDIEESSSSSEEIEIFFDEEYNEKLKIITNPILKEIPKYFRSKIKKTKKSSIHLYKVFKKVYSKLGMSNPLTYKSPVDAIDQGDKNIIALSTPIEEYPKSYFFIKNHFEYFKKRFKPRNSENEKPYKGVISSFIDDEFKRLIGYKQPISKDETTSNTTNKNVINKPKRGGF